MSAPTLSVSAPTLRGCEGIEDSRATAKGGAEGPAGRADRRRALPAGDRAKPISSQTLSAGPFDALEQATEGLLRGADATVDVEEEAVPAPLQRLEAPRGGFVLRARSQSLAVEGRPLAHCRTVRITNDRTDIYNVMIFPAVGAVLPVFAAELLVFGGALRLAFIDLQVPGLDAAVRDRVRAQTVPLAAGVEDEQDLCVPAWATAYASGGHLFLRADAREGREPTVAAAERAFAAYLEGWRELLLAGATEKDRCGAVAAGVAAYKHHHVASTPGGPFLAKLFGPEPAQLVLSGFLYA